MHSSILSQCRDLSKGRYVQFCGFQLLREQGNFAVTEDEIFVFAIKFGKVSYNSRILNVQEK